MTDKFTKEINHQQLAKVAGQWLQPASLAYLKSDGWLEDFIAAREADNTPKLTENNCMNCGKLTTQKGPHHVLCNTCWTDMHGRE